MVSGGQTERCSIGRQQISNVICIQDMMVLSRAQYCGTPCPYPSNGLNADISFFLVSSFNPSVRLLGSAAFR